MRGTVYTGKGYLPRTPKTPESLERASADERRRRIPRQHWEALFRTRTGDPFLTMEVLYQLS